LNIPRYVDTFEEEERMDLEAVARELSALEGKIKATDETIADYCKELGINIPFWIPHNEWWVFGENKMHTLEIELPDELAFDIQKILNQQDIKQFSLDAIKAKLLQEQKALQKKNLWL